MSQIDAFYNQIDKTKKKKIVIDQKYPKEMKPGMQGSLLCGK